MTKLPYDFDLYFDIKSVEELHGILLEDSLDNLHDQGDLEELMDAHAIPFPEGYIRINKTGFTEEIKAAFERYDNKKVLASKILNIKGMEEAIVDELADRGYYIVEEN